MTVWLPSKNRQMNASFFSGEAAVFFLKQAAEALEVCLEQLFKGLMTLIVHTSFSFFTTTKSISKRFASTRVLCPRLTRQTLLLLPLLLTASLPAFANNATIRNVALIERDINAKTIQVKFDISWQNSWSDPVNHDAVWVFVKYSTAGSSGPWFHATMKTAGTNPTGFDRGTKDTSADSTPTVPASDYNSIAIVVPADRKGAFIRPGHQRDSAGTVNFDSVELVWDYAADGLTDAQARASTTFIKVFALEMVFIPEGGFYVGDTQSGTNGQFEFGDGSLNLAPAINSEGGISFRNASSGYWYYNTDSVGNDEVSGASFDVSEAFPKGFQAFYLMKHEITQGMYREFLNTLTSTQDSNRFPNQNGNNRHEIAGTAGARTVGNADRACNFLLWTDLTAFADWAALRPLSELEYEKAGRGSLTPVSAEYAWGTTSKTNCATLSGAEDGTETCTTANANASFGNAVLTGGDAGSGPIRAGIFAAATNTRAATGAGFYGNLELTGNVSEMTVTLGNASGRGYSGSHGDGALTTNGFATNEDWPGFVFGSGVTGSTGQGIRGGSWSDTTDARGEISDRFLAADHVSTRTSSRGGRCARTSP
ncbi:MAG: hypothetical protein FGM27_08950 [Candidatus Omnitrophica bacterium]|nr:hypothetical protein [Candidatus Omnitrophota bacterium]